MNIHSHQIHPVGEQFLDRHIIEVQGRLHQLGFVLLHDTLFLDGIQDIFELFFGHGRALVPLGTEPHHGTLKQLEDTYNRSEQNDQKMHRSGNGQRQLFAVFLTIGLGQDLTEDEHQHSGDSGGDHSTRCTEQSGGHGSHQGSGSGIYHIVAHQDGGKGTVIVLYNIQSQLCFFAAVIRITFQADLVDGGKGCFRCGKIR